MSFQNRHPEDVKAAIRKRGVTVSGLAEREGLHPSTTRAALIRPQPAGNKVIAKFLDTTVHDIWPEWFDKQGHRIDRKKFSRRAAIHEGQKGKAA